MSKSKVAVDSPITLEDTITSLERLVQLEPDLISNDAIQRIFTAAFQLYWNRADAGAIVDPFTEDSRTTATQIAVVTTHLLHSQNLEVFELALWQSWEGAPSIKEIGETK